MEAAGEECSDEAANRTDQNKVKNNSCFRLMKHAEFLNKCCGICSEEARG